MALTDGAPSPDLFRRWAGIAELAGAMERRVWVRAGAKSAVFPNLYCLLVGPPGTGKFIIEDVRGHWSEVVEPGTKVPAFRVAPDSMTKASLMDTIAKAKNTRITPSGPPYSYHSLLIAAEEFGVLVPDYEPTYIHSINSIFNNKAVHEESRRTGSVRELKIENPQVTILGGATPNYLADTFPEQAWTTGLARRILMVYAEDPPKKDLFYEPELHPEARGALLEKLGLVSQLYGQCKWEPSAAEHIAGWDRDDCPPKPTHSKLEHYNRSRTLQAMKLSVISCVSRTGKLVIGLPDVKRAIAWLIEIERLMPDIFRSMVGKSDAQVLEELHLFVETLWRKNKQQGVSGAMIEKFLSARVPSEKIERLRMVAERADMIARVAGTQDLFVPRPKHEHAE